MATAMKRRTARLYWPNCAVCQYMKKNKQFRYDVMQSTYFNPNGSDSLIDVNLRYGSPFKPTALYQHMKRHQAKDIIKAEERAVAPIKGQDVLTVVESSVDSNQLHERGLDEFILEGRNKLARGEMLINATSYLQAIKIKADIEKSTKDRRLDAFKTLAGAAPGIKPEGTN